MNLKKYPYLLKQIIAFFQKSNDILKFYNKYYTFITQR